MKKFRFTCRTCGDCARKKGFKETKVRERERIRKKGESFLYLENFQRFFSTVFQFLREVFI